MGSLCDNYVSNSERYELLDENPSTLNEIGCELLNQLEKLNENLENIKSRQDSIDDTLVEILRRLNRGISVYE